MEEIESLREVIRLQARVIESQGEVEQILSDLYIPESLREANENIQDSQS